MSDKEYICIVCLNTYKESDLLICHNCAESICPKCGDEVCTIEEWNKPTKTEMNEVEQ